MDLPEVVPVISFEDSSQDLSLADSVNFIELRDMVYVEAGDFYM